MKVSEEVQCWEPPWLAVLKSQIEPLHLGVLQVVVHDSQVVQINRAEKVRFGWAEQRLLASPPVSVPEIRSEQP